MKPPMFQVSGFLDDRTWSVARAIFAKSVMKVSSSIAKAETTNLTGHHERDGHEGRLQDRPADLVDDPRQDPLVDRPPLLDQRHDVGQPRFGQDDARRALGHVGRGADGDAHFGLAQGGRIVDAVARHADHMPRSLQVLHDEVFVLRVNFGKAIGARQKIDRLVAGLRARSLQVRHAPDIRQPDSPADLTRNRQRVAGEHLHRNAEVVKCP